MPSSNEVQSRIQAGITGSEAAVEDLNGNGDHFSVAVKAAAFEGKSLIEQHQMIYAALGDAMKEEIHALSIQTSI